MSLHEDTPKCKHMKCFNNLCPFNHHDKESEKPCDQWTYLARSDNDLNSHISEFHREESTSLTLIQNEQKSCESCDFIGSSVELLNTHVGDKHTEEIIHLSEDEQNYDLYVRHNYEEVYDSFVEGKSRIRCFYCNYTSNSRILFNIQGEICDHLKSEQVDILTSYDPDFWQWPAWRFVGLFCWIIKLSL